jgi:elongation factor Ts
LEITVSMVKELRQETGAGVLDCRKALENAGGDFEAAVAELREKGLAEAAERGEREATNGCIEAYAHGDLYGTRIGVLLELNCETDFVAGTEDFKNLAHELALHIAFAAPRYLTREDVPEEESEREQAERRAEALEQGKPEHIVGRIVEGQMEKFYKQVCIMEQPFVKDEDKTIHDLITEAVAKLGENVVLRRFVRYELGEELG